MNRSCFFSLIFIFLGIISSNSVAQSDTSVTKYSLCRQTLINTFTDIYQVLLEQKFILDFLKVDKEQVLSRLQSLDVQVGEHLYKNGYPVEALNVPGAGLIVVDKNV